MMTNDLVVLIIEDDPSLAGNINRVLEENGYSRAAVVSCDTEALEFIEGNKVDIVLADVDSLPGSRGIELARRIEDSHKLPVIFMGDEPDSETLELSKSAGLYGYMPKTGHPVSLIMILELVYQRYWNDHVYRMMYMTLENMTEAVVMVEEDREIVFYNRQAEKLLFLEPYRQFIESGRQLLIPELPFFIMDGTPFPNVLTADELPERLYFLREEKTETMLDCSVSKVFFSSQGHFSKVFVFRNVTTDNLLSEIQTFLHTLVETADDIVAGLNNDGYIKTWNHGAINFTGISLNEAISRHISEIFPEVTFPDFSRTLKILETQEYFFHSNRYKKAYLLAHLSPLLGAGDYLFGYSFICRDITERTLMERQIIEAAENERIKIAQNLHDGLGQQLTGLSFKIRALQMAIGNNRRDDANTLAQEVADLTRQAISETRELSRGLIPEVLKTDGFDEVIRSLTESTSKNCNIAITYQSHGTETLNTDERTQFYHIIKEGINNAVKHSGATELAISLDRKSGGYVLSIRDNGQGFDIKKIKKGLGMSNMRYRSDIINGELEIRSFLGEGTEIICRLKARRRYRGTEIR